MAGSRSSARLWLCLAACSVLPDLDAIDELRIRDNTIVVFTSDNGPEATWPWQGSPGPWRGYYFTHMEGSLRVPFIIRWPGRVPAARVSNEIVHEVDTYTTFAKIAGVAIALASLGLATSIAAFAADRFVPAAPEAGTTIPHQQVKFGMRPFADNTFYVIAMQKG